MDRNQEFVNKGIQVGSMLGRKLKLRSEERSLITPRMKTGKVSGRLLHEVGMGNFNIFDQTVINKHNPALVHISIDASSSMGGDKWESSQIAAVAIAKAASMTSNLNVVISYRSINGHSNNTVQPLMFIAYDSRKDKFSKIQQLFRYINPTGTTPEGLCFEIVKWIIVAIRLYYILQLRSKRFRLLGLRFYLTSSLRVIMGIIHHLIILNECMVRLLNKSMLLP